jgi:hypothetical protein
MLDGQPHVGLNNKDVSSLKYLLGVWFIIHTYGENPIRSGKIILCVSHILRQKIIVANCDKTFVIPTSWKKKGEGYKL